MCCDQRNQLTWGDRLVAFFVVFFVWLSPKISNICIHFISENLVIKLCKYFGFKLCFRLIFLFSAKIKTFITLAFTKKIIWRFFFVSPICFLLFFFLLSVISILMQTVCFSCSLQHLCLHGTNIVYFIWL